MKKTITICALVAALSMGLGGCTPKITEQRTINGDQVTYSTFSADNGNQETLTILQSDGTKVEYTMLNNPFSPYRFCTTSPDQMPKCADLSDPIEKEKIVGTYLRKLVEISDARLEDLKKK